MDLFKHAGQKKIEQESPLANRLRPRTLEEYVGQEHIIGPGRLLRRAIEADQLSSLIFYGPPGTGKTTLAMVIANTTRSHFVTMNAVMSGVRELREVVAEASERQQLYGTRTTLFVDEVHRWNKAQQDALLPYVEKGIVILIGATTANPYFEVNKALVSRSRIFQLRPLDKENLRQIARRALADKRAGYGHLAIELRPEALDHLVSVANGDARGVLNALELAVETTPPNKDGVIDISLAVAEESIQQRAVLYDKDGDAHYDHISAFIKSLRGSDPDAALYWAAKMIYAGEDPTFLFRRMGIFAGEDVGLADPQAAVVVDSCWSLYERIGLPEGQFPLAQAILYLATAPKSNTSFAFFDALRAVGEEQADDVPNHLKDANRDAKGFGHGAGYRYPHAYQDHWVAQQYLPGALQGQVFYRPSDQGYEGELAAAVLRRREAQLAALQLGEEDAPEMLTAGPVDRGREVWLQRTLSTTGEMLGKVRDRLMGLARLQRHHVVLDLKADSGLLLWEAVRRTPEGGVWGIAAAGRREELEGLAGRLAELERPRLIGSLDDLDDPALRFDRILAYHVWSGRPLYGAAAELARWRELLRPDGLLVLAQPLPQDAQRIVGLVDWGEERSLREAAAEVEESLWRAGRGAAEWGEGELAAALTGAGFPVEIAVETESEQRRLSAALVRRWFEQGNPFFEALRAALDDETAVARVQKRYFAQLANQVVDWSTRIAYISCRRSE